MFFPMMFVMSIVAFGLIQAPPGDFLTDLLAYREALDGGSIRIEQEEIDALTRYYGLDKPIYVQYFKWVGGIIRWDLGVSNDFGKPVTELINERLALTVTLGLMTIIFTWTLALPIGIISAVKQYSFIDYTFTFLSLSGCGDAQLPPGPCDHVVYLRLVRHQDHRAFFARVHRGRLGSRQDLGHAEAYLGAPAYSGHRRHRSPHTHRQGQSAGRDEQTVRGEPPAPRACPNGRLSSSTPRAWR